MTSARRKLQFSVSVRHLPLTRLGACLEELKSVEGTELVVDVCDGNFAPGFALGFEVIEAVRSESSLPIHIRLLAEQPERYIADFAGLGCAAMTVPVEACAHAHRTFTLIREAGMKPGVSINPGTALTKLEYVLPLVDSVLVPVRDIRPGDSPATDLPRAAFERVRILRENIDYHGTGATISVEGGLRAIDAARLATGGANSIVIDRPEVLRADSLADSIRSFISSVHASRQTA
jgi:ribulose-phosphate 3-epimerase